MARPLHVECCDPITRAMPSGRRWFHSNFCTIYPRVKVGEEPQRPTSCAWHAQVVSYLVTDICGGPNCRAYREYHSDDGKEAAEV